MSSRTLGPSHGKVAEALGESLGELFEAPDVQQGDVIAAKLPGDY